MGLIDLLRLLNKLLQSWSNLSHVLSGGCEHLGKLIRCSWGTENTHPVIVSPLPDSILCHPIKFLPSVWQEEVSITFVTFLLGVSVIFVLVFTLARIVTCGLVSRNDRI